MHASGGLCLNLAKIFNFLTSIVVVIHENRFVINKHVLPAMYVSLWSSVYDFMIVRPLNNYNKRLSFCTTNQNTFGFRLCPIFKSVMREKNGITF